MDRKLTEEVIKEAVEAFIHAKEWLKCSTCIQNRGIERMAEDIRSPK